MDTNLREKRLQWKAFSRVLVISIATTWKSVPLPLSGRWAAGRCGRWLLEGQTRKSPGVNGSRAALSVSKTFTHRSIPPTSFSLPALPALISPTTTSVTTTSSNSSSRLSPLWRTWEEESVSVSCPTPPCFECAEELKQERKRGRTEVFSLSRRAVGAPGLVSEQQAGNVKNLSFAITGRPDVSVSLHITTQGSSCNVQEVFASCCVASVQPLSGPAC